MKDNKEKIGSIENALNMIHNGSFTVSSNKSGSDFRIKIQEDVLKINLQKKDLRNILNLFLGNDKINVQVFSGQVSATFSNFLTNESKNNIKESLATTEHSHCIFLEAPVTRKESIVDRFTEELERLKNSFSNVNRRRPMGF